MSRIEKLFLNARAAGTLPVPANCFGKLLHWGNAVHYILGMPTLRRWMPIIICLLAVWGGVAVTLRAVQSGKPTVNSALAILESRPGAGEPADVRRAWIDSFASHLAKMELDARHKILMDPRLRSAFVDMPSDDQSFYLGATQTPGMAEFIEGAKTWSPAHFNRLLPASLAELEELHCGARARFESLIATPSAGQNENSGIAALLVETDPLTQFDARPLIERVQKNSQMGLL